MKVSVFFGLSLIFGACTVHDHSSHEGSGVQVTPAAQQQEMQHQPANEAKLPPAPPAPGKKLPPPSKPKSAPEPQQEESPPATDEAPDDAATDAEEVPATDEEMFDGCGPMEEPISCEWNYDCPPYEVPWMTNACSQGVCSHDPTAIEFNYTDADIDPSKLCVTIYRLRADGWWHGDTHSLPHTVPLELLCTSLEKDAYVSPQIAGQVLAKTKRVEFAFTWCGQDSDNLYFYPSAALKYSGFSVNFMPEYMKKQNKIGLNPDPIGKFPWSYIKGLGSDCGIYSGQGADQYLWD